MKTCEVCESQFEAKRGDARLCGAVCRRISAALKEAPIRALTRELERRNGEAILTGHPVHGVKVGPVGEVAPAATRERAPEGAHELTYEEFGDL